MPCPYKKKEGIRANEALFVSKEFHKAIKTTKQITAPKEISVKNS